MTNDLLTPEERTALDARAEAHAQSMKPESQRGHDDLDYDEKWEGKYPEPVLHHTAYHGIIGDIINETKEQTEADPAGMLMESHVALGNLVGASNENESSPYVRIDGTYLKTNFFLAKIGLSAKARKGHGWNAIKRVLEKVDQDWFSACLTSGLSTGEGLIFSLRDASEQADDSDSSDANSIVIDRRALVIEPELSKVFKVKNREGNTLSEILRDAWDGSVLRTKTRREPLQASHTHISIIGHSTPIEINETLDNLSMANGLGNRFLFCAVKRQRELPFGGNITDEQIHDLAEKIKAALGKARCIRAIKFSREAAQIWNTLYRRGFPEKPGLAGTLVGRGDTQTLKLAENYAAYDGSNLISIDHLRAAYACWKYSEASAYYIFGDRVGDPGERRLLEAAREAHPKGIDNAAQREATSGRRTKDIRASLIRQGLLQEVKSPAQGNGGRESVMVFAVLKSERKPDSTLALLDDDALWDGTSPLLEPLDQFEQFAQFEHRKASLPEPPSLTISADIEPDAQKHADQNVAPLAQIAQFAQIASPNEAPWSETI